MKSIIQLSILLCAEQPRNSGSIKIILNHQHDLFFLLLAAWQFVFRKQIDQIAQKPARCSLQGEFVVRSCSKHTCCLIPSPNCQGLKDVGEQLAPCITLYTQNYFTFCVIRQKSIYLYSNVLELFPIKYVGRIEVSREIFHKRVTYVYSFPPLQNQ